MANLDLDIVDKRLLAALQIDAKTPIVDLAETCGASTASVQRRIKRLKTRGIIHKETIEIDRKRAGFSVKAIISVELERDSVAETNAFKQKVKDENYIQHSYCVAGDADFLLIVVAEDMDEYEAFTHRFFYSDQNIRKFRTSIVVSEQKSSNHLPVLEIEPMK